MSCRSRTRAALGASLTVALASAAPIADAYPIDCAILLCLAGGFPTSAECAAAHAEVIRRITPWPIEPPLQLWNCPLGDAAEVGAGIQAYREGIEVWNVSKAPFSMSRHQTALTTAEKFSFNPAGQFRGERVSPSKVPDEIEQQILGQAAQTIPGQFGYFRGILLRTVDSEGASSHTWIPY